MPFRAQLDLQKALLDAVQKMAAFVETNGEIAGGLEGGINQLAQGRFRKFWVRARPESTSQQTIARPAPTPAKPSLANSGGLISEAMTLYDYMSAVRQIDGADQRNQLYARRGGPVAHAAARRVAGDHSAESERWPSSRRPPIPRSLQTERQDFQELTERFKQLSGALLPLSQEIIVLDDSKTNFEEWRNSIERESRQYLALRTVSRGWDSSWRWR